MRALIPAATLLLAMTASAQRPKTPPASQKSNPASSAASAKQAGAPAAEPKVAKDPTSIAIYPFSPGTVANVAQYQVGGMALNLAIANRVTEAFMASQKWIVLPRSQDQTLANEMTRAHGVGNFDSQVAVEDSKHLNARYILTGVLESVQQTTVIEDGCPAYHISIQFNATITDVESDAALASKGFTGSWPSANAATLVTARAEKTQKDIANKAAQMFGFGGKSKAQKCATDAQATAAQNALTDVKNLLAQWAAETYDSRK